VRLASGLAAAGTALVTGAISGALGGSVRARLVASLSWAVGGVSLVSGHFVDTATFDILATAAVCLCLIRALTQGSNRWLIVAGGALGLSIVPIDNLTAVGGQGRWSWSALRHFDRGVIREFAVNDRILSKVGADHRLEQAGSR
jgi:hypothetical protein